MEIVYDHKTKSLNEREGENLLHASMKMNRITQAIINCTF